MSKYHINPATGEVSTCKARFKKCPFESEHFSTPEEARYAFEKAMSAFQYRRTKEFEVFTPEEVEYLSRNFIFTGDAEKSLNDEKSFQDGRHEAFKNNMLTFVIPAELQVSLNVYCSEDHSKIINEHLREGVEIPEAYVPHLANLDNFTDTYEKELQGEIKYTGIPLSTTVDKEVLFEQLKLLKPGAPVKFDGFISSSISFNRALEFATGGKEKLIIEIDSDNGHFINESVEEVFFPRTCSFYFLSAEKWQDLHEYLVVRLTSRRMS